LLIREHGYGIMRKSRALLGIVAVVAAMLLGTGGSAGAAAKLPGWINIENYDATLCVDIGSNAPGTWLGLGRGCDIYSSSQAFSWQPDPTLNLPYILSKSSGLCLDLPSNNVGATVVLAPCQAGYTSQKWYKRGSGTYYQIQNYNGLCMDIGSTAPGTRVGMAVCQDNYLSQKWFTVLG
jgi:hypothetical protein